MAINYNEEAINKLQILYESEVERHLHSTLTRRVFCF